MVKPDVPAHPCTRRINGLHQSITQPLVVQLYNQNYGGVDRFDQCRAKYRVGRFSKKSWKYLFHFFLHTAVVNSYIVFKEISTRKHGKKRYAQLDYRIDLIKDLFGDFSSRTRSAAVLPSTPTSGRTMCSITPSTSTPNSTPGSYMGHYPSTPTSRTQHSSIQCFSAHQNVHMKAKRPRRCIAHARFQPNEKARKETAYGCPTCDVHLCKDCHFPYHTQNQ